MAKGQMRCKEGYRVHVQIKGPEGNRSYGFAADYEIDPIIWNALKSIEATLPSLAGTDKKYFPIELQAINEMTTLIKTEIGNFKIYDTYLADYVRTYAKQLVGEISEEATNTFIEIPVNQKGINKIRIYFE